MIISVIITTYNRADRLQECLASLRDQTLDTSQFEVIVVDNGSTDNTEELVRPYCESGLVRYFHESRQGMNYARNLGLSVSRGDFIAYIDDDAKADLNWLFVASKLIKEIDPTPDCLGGPIYPYYTTTKPFWFDDKYEIRRNWNNPRYLTKDESFSGSNMIWKREVLLALGGFDTHVGVTGNTLRLGGETIVFNKVWSQMQHPHLYYSPELIVQHWVPDYKMKIMYRMKRSVAMGQYLGTVDKSKLTSERIKIILSSLLQITKRTVRAILKFSYYPNWQNWVVEEGAPVLLHLGRMLWLLNIRPRLKQETK